MRPPENTPFTLLSKLAENMEILFMNVWWGGGVADKLPISSSNIH